MTRKSKKGSYLVSLVIAIILLLAVTVVGAFSSSKVSITGEGFLSVSSGMVLAVEKGMLGTGEPVSLQMGPIGRRGGPPVISVTYNFDAIEDEESILVIRNSYGIPDILVGKAKMKAKAKGKGQIETAAEVEVRIKEEEVQLGYEIWILLSSICDLEPEDSVCQGTPMLQDNERIEKVTGKDYLVTTVAYFDIHIYSLEPLRFATRINGLDAGPVVGNWW